MCGIERSILHEKLIEFFCVLCTVVREHDTHSILTSIVPYPHPHPHPHTHIHPHLHIHPHPHPHTHPHSHPRRV